MKKNLLFLTVLSFLCFLSFFFFSRYVRNRVLKDFDFAATVKIQEKIDTSSRLRTAAFIANIMEGSTFLASPEVSVIAVLLITGFAFRKLKWRAFAIPILFALLVAGEVYGKTVVEHPSPPFSFIKNPHTMFPPEYINDQYSYPSGHAARAIFIALVIGSGFVVRGKKKIIVWSLLGVYVGLVSVSRIYLGHHWMSDVIGGWLLGSGLGVLTAVGKPRIM